MSNINTITDAGGNQIAAEQYTDFNKILLTVLNPMLKYGAYGRKETFKKVHLLII